MHVQEVVPGVFLTAPEAPGLRVPNVYLVRGERAAAVVDAGYGKAEELEALEHAWQKAGRPVVEALYLTHRHRDHTDGAATVRRTLSVRRVLCAPEERRPIEEAHPGLRVDHTPEDGEVLDLGGVTLRVLHTPGHTLGSLCLLLEERGALFTGDTVLGTGPVVVVPGEGDMGQYLRSLERLAGLESLRVILPGHGAPVEDEPHAYLRRLMGHRLRRERQVLEHLADGARSVEDLFQRIYPHLDDRLHRTAKSQLVAHLQKLEKEGRVRRTGPDSFVPS